VKIDEPILVVIGNPPYSIHSKNNKDWIIKLISRYKEDINEKNIQPLNDDYVKFLRYAEWKINKNGMGVIGLISNNSYLDGIIFKVMRKKLLETFDRIYILNLHGNKKKGEKDENVFDIVAGVSISLFVKLPNSLENKEVFYYSTLENSINSREEKYDFLLKEYVSSVKWNKLDPKEPDYWFVNKNLDSEEEYNKGWSLIDIFKDYGSGIQTGRDDLFIDFDINKLKNKISILFSNNISKEFITKYKVRSTGGYDILNKLLKYSYDENKINKIHYRPYDIRVSYYHEGLIRRPAYTLMNHFLKGDNLGLVFSRQVVGNEWKHVFITKDICDEALVSLKTREWTYTAPLFLYSKDSRILSEVIGDFKNPYENMYPVPNFSKTFIEFISKKFDIFPTPQEIFKYIYSILHSKTYRERYYEFLKIDFPKIPFTENYDMFLELSNLGNELILNHLLKKDYSKSEIGKFEVEGDSRITSAIYDKSKNKLYINESQSFDNVPHEVWKFEIGGYRVLDKWLKERQKHNITLTYEDITTFKKIINSLNETIEIMGRIDETYKKTFPNNYI